MDDFAAKCAEFFKRDRFATQAGIKIVEAKPGFAKVEMLVEDKHLNGADVLHGGALFTMADFAFAIASNTRGRIALSVNASMNFIKAVKAGETISAVAKEISLGHKLGTYSIEVANSKGEAVATMQGTVYRKDEQIKAFA
jgi:acyl-CoA thioesterase